MAFIDVGAWIGSTALYASKKVNKTIAFEPDPIAFKELQTNVELNQKRTDNGDIMLYNAAISFENGEVTLGTSGEGGDSLSSMIKPDAYKTWTVQSMVLSDVLNKHLSGQDKVFCKVDIEGFEYDLVPSLDSLLHREHTWFYISLHPQPPLQLQ